MNLLKTLYNYGKSHGLDKEAFFGENEVEWLLKVDPAGLITLERLHGPRKKRGMPMLLPIPIKKTVNVAPNFPAENAVHVFGIDLDPDDPLDPEQITARHEAYIAQIARVARESGDKALEPLVRALEARAGRWETHPEVKKALKDGMTAGDCICPAVLEGSEWQPIALRESMRKWWIGHYGELQKMDAGRGTCLVTGEKDVPLARLHPLIRNVKGGLPTGITLVTFNDSSAESFGKKQGMNAPVSVEAAVLCAKSLSQILSQASGKKRAVKLSDGVHMAFVTQRLEDEAAADFVLSLLDPVEKDFDPPAGYAGREVGVWRSHRVLFGSPRKGVLPAAPTTPVDIFMAQLRPTSSRVEILMQEEHTFGEIHSNLVRYFSDLAVLDPWTKEVRSDFPIRTVWAPKKEGEKGVVVARGLIDALRNPVSEDLPPEDLVADLYAAAVRGTPIPPGFLPWTQSVISRNARAGKTIPAEAIALLKAYFIREYRRPGSLLPGRWNACDPDFKEVNPMLDPACKHPAYVLGRVLAVAERFQEMAIPGVNASVVKRLFDGISMSPGSMMPSVLKDMNHHIAKLARAKPGLAVWCQKLIGGILDLLPADPAKAFPKALDLQDQALFSLGYFHQRTDLFKKKEVESVPENEGEAA